MPCSRSGSAKQHAVQRPRNGSFPALHCGERVKAPNGKAAHLNQKPLDLMSLIINASSDEGDIIWEPFGGLFSASVAAWQAGRRACAAEIDSTYFQLGVRRFSEPAPMSLNL